MTRLRELLLRLGANFRGIFDLESSGEMMAYAVIVGVVAGFGAWLFAEGSDRMKAVAHTRQAIEEVKLAIAATKKEKPVPAPTAPAPLDPRP